MHSVLLFLLRTLVSVLPIAGAQAPASPPSERPDDYGIYNAALTAFVSGDKRTQMSVVRLTKMAEDGIGDCLDKASSTPQWRSAVADLRQRNIEARTLEPRFTLPFKYDMADELEVVGGARAGPLGQARQAFLAEQIEKLERMERMHYVQVQLSLPGVSADKQRAVVYVAVPYAGVFVGLRKKGNRWAEAREVCSWIS